MENGALSKSYCEDICLLKISVKNIYAYREITLKTRPRLQTGDPFLMFSRYNGGNVCVISAVCVHRVNQRQRARATHAIRFSYRPAAETVCGDDDDDSQRYFRLENAYSNSSVCFVGNGFPFV